MKKGILLGILILALIVFPSVSAREYSNYYKNGDAPIIKRECFDEGSVCDVSFNCNITIYNPDGSLLISDIVMNRASDHYNYSLDHLTTNGEYRTRVSCSDGTNTGSEIFYFKVTPAGDDRNNTLFLIFSLSALSLLMLAFLFKSDPLGMISGLAFLVTGVYVMINGLGAFSDIYTRAIAFISIGIGLLFIGVTAYSMSISSSIGGEKDEW